MDIEEEEKCRFCHIKLLCGMDKDKMIHCQYCHLIWDGCAQCPCGNIENDE
jgi:hypothetical protein